MGMQILLQYVKVFHVGGKELDENNLVGTRKQKSICPIRDSFLVRAASCRGVRTVLDLEGRKPSWSVSSLPKLRSWASSGVLI